MWWCRVLQRKMRFVALLVPRRPHPCAHISGVKILCRFLWLKLNHFFSKKTISAVLRILCFDLWYFDSFSVAGQRRVWCPTPGTTFCWAVTTSCWMTTTFSRTSTACWTELSWRRPSKRHEQYAGLVVVMVTTFLIHVQYAGLVVIATTFSKTSTVCWTGCHSDNLFKDINGMLDCLS